MRTRFVVGNELRHSLTWRNSYEDQASDLAGRFQDDILGTQTGVARPGPYVLVGHSHGGLVSRYMAQNLSDPSKVLGVVSVSSPHGGAYLANFGQGILAGALSVSLTSGGFGCDVAGAYVCNRSGALASSVTAAIGSFLADNAVPVLQEMGTNAAFHNTINGRGDAAFRVAGVQNQIWNRWTLWRLLGDHQQCVQPLFISCDDYSRRYVNAADKTYHHYIDCSVIGGLFGFVWPQSFGVAAGCAKNAGTMIAIDYAYRHLSVGSGTGDGVVPLWSQYFPGAPNVNQILVDDSDSHLGETKSKTTAQGIVIAINRAMGIPLAQ